MKLTGKTKILLVLTIVFGIIGIVTLNFTNLLALEVVKVNAEPLSDWNSKLGFEKSAIISQPVDSVVETLLNKKNIYKVDLSYNLPNEIEIRTNNYEPVCFGLDRLSGSMYGVTAEGRIVSLTNCTYSWDNPILTSISVPKIYGFATDFRVKNIVQELMRLQKQNIDLYKLINEIDFGNSYFLKVSIDGLAYRLKLRSDNFINDMNKFISFVTKYNPDLTQVKLVDLRFDEMIICNEDD